MDTTALSEYRGCRIGDSSAYGTDDDQALCKGCDKATRDGKTLSDDRYDVANVIEIETGYSHFVIQLVRTATSS